nr:hypothetical protein [Tanacetum cinerariifolium]
MVTLLSKFDASAGFDQIVDFLNAQVIQYALMVNPTIYVSCIKQFWATASNKKANDVVKLQALIDGKRVVENSTSLKEEDEVEVPAAPTPPSPTNVPSPHPQDPIPTPPQARPAPSSSPPQEQPTDTFESSMTLLNTLMETCVELQGRKDDNNAAIKDASAAEPTVFDDEEITMTMAQTLIKIKAKKARLLDEQMAKTLHDEEVEQDPAREKQEKYDLEKAKGLQQQKNMIIYLKNMAGYNMEYFIGMTYDKESFKKLKAVEVSGSHSTQDTLTNDLKEMSKEDVKNMLEIVLVSEFKVKALQVNAKLQVEEDSEMARNLVMKIFIEANKPKSRSKNDSAAEELKNYSK